MKLRHGFSSGDGPLRFSHSFGGPAPFRRRPFLQNHQVRGQRAARGGEGAGLASQGSQVRLSSGGRVGAGKRVRHAGERESVGDGAPRSGAQREGGSSHCMWDICESDAANRQLQRARAR